MAAPTVEASPAPATVGRTAGRAFRQCWKPTAVATLDRSDIGPAAATILARINKIGGARSCGAYLFVTPELEAFVLSEETAAALAWVRDRIDCLVGFYRGSRRRGIPSAPLTLEALTEDLADFVAQRGDPA